MSEAVRIHPTAIVEDGVVIGAGTSIWDNVHVRGPATIGRDCIVGEKTYIAYGVRIGDYVKVNAQAYICTGVTIEERVFVAAGVVFTNDRFPRAFADGHDGLAPSEPNEDTLETVVRTGATIGARAVIGPGIEIGSYAMIGMGAIVAADVPPHALVFGAPARVRGWVCVCGTPVVRGDDADAAVPQTHACERCGRRYQFVGDDSRLLREVA
jgi:UDP-2-acetamido-3-amino-2,3-dideoxy-glucuronate N-acetyltransferase